MSTTTANPVQTENRLSKIFNPSSIALVGASERSYWAQMIMSQITKMGFSGEIYMVNGKGGTVFGKEAYASVTDIPLPVDLAFIVVPAEAVPAVIQNMADAGIRQGLILTSGFGETGKEGKEIQDQIVALANSKGITLLGPNSLGYINFKDRVAATFMAFEEPIIPGGVAFITQSGSYGLLLALFAYQQGIGLNYQIHTGNEAQVNTTDLVEYLLEDESTRSIALFLEGVRDAEGFRKVAKRALELQKPIVVMKVGTGEITAKVAQAHTGALVGDDRVFDAICSQYGIIRVASGEELLITADILSKTGPLEKPGIGIVSISGGAAEVIADKAELCGVELPEFAEATKTKLREVLPSYASTYNPLDVTGAATRTPELWEKVIQIVADDPSVGFTAVAYVIPEAERPDRPNDPSVHFIGKGLQGKAGLLMNQPITPITSYSLKVLEEAGIKIGTGGVDYATAALGHLSKWSDKVKKGIGKQESNITLSKERPLTEKDTLAYLHTQGVPVISQMLARTGQEAVTFARELGEAVVLKISSPDIPHKTEAGGVLLNLSGEEAVASAFDKIVTSAKAYKPDARIEGVIVSPMRHTGTELLVGTAKDPVWGPVIAVGLGGVLVEVLKDTALRTLPVTPADVLEMLGELKGGKLLDGFRGAAPANKQAIAERVAQIGNAALALGDSLVSLEINPLYVNGDQVECLDALAVWE